jgi:hypothetical protein
MADYNTLFVFSKISIFCDKFLGGVSTVAKEQIISSFELEETHVSSLYCLNGFPAKKIKE